MGSLSTDHTVMIPPVSFEHVSSRLSLPVPAAVTMRSVTLVLMCASFATIAHEPNKNPSNGIGQVIHLTPLAREVQTELLTRADA